MAFVSGSSAHRASQRFISLLMNECCGANVVDAQMNEYLQLELSLECLYRNIDIRHTSPMT